MKRTWILSVLVIVGFLLATGCRARFKKYAKKSSGVQVRPNVTSGPTVDLAANDDGEAQSQAEAMTNLATGIAGAAAGAKVRKRLVSVLGPNDIEKMIDDGVKKGLGGGPPFPYRKKKGDGTLQIEVERYGVVNEGDGPIFVVDYDVGIFRKKDNKRVYRNSVRCRDGNFFLGGPESDALNTVATIAFFENMSDAQLQKRIRRTFRACTARLVSQMQKHAS